MATKSWYLSKTLWANIISIIAILLVSRGIEIDTESQAVMATCILAVINLILRIKTNQGIK